MDYSNLNIKQITQYDIPTSNAEIGEPALVIENQNIIKLGYECEPSGYDYPIYLKVGQEYLPFYVGPEGIYEFQVELFEQKEIRTVITGVKVPYGIKFNLNYVIN